MPDREPSDLPAWDVDLQIADLPSGTKTRDPFINIDRDAGTVALLQIRASLVTGCEHGCVCRPNLDADVTIGRYYVPVDAVASDTNGSAFRVTGEARIRLTEQQGKCWNRAGARRQN